MLSFTLSIYTSYGDFDMFSLDMNKRLWKDVDIFERFHYTILMLNKEVAENNFDPKMFLNYANKLDDILQEYEGKYGSIEDPIFFWSFATANALFLLVGKKYDELGPARIAYVINGYMEGLNKHEIYPSYPKIYIEKAFEHMKPFAKGKDAEWIDKNQNSFVPISG